MFFTRMFRSSVKSSLPVWKIRLLLGYISIIIFYNKNNKILFPAKFFKTSHEIHIERNMDIK